MIQHTHSLVTISVIIIIINSLSRKNKAAVNLKTGRFDSIDSAIIISCVCKIARKLSSDPVIFGSVRDRYMLNCSSAKLCVGHIPHGCGLTARPHSGFRTLLLSLFCCNLKFCQDVGYQLLLTPSLML